MYGFDSRLIQSGNSSCFVECFRLDLIRLLLWEANRGITGNTLYRQWYEVPYDLADQVAIYIAVSCSVYFGQFYEAPYDLTDQVAINIASSCSPSDSWSVEYFLHPITMCLSPLSSWSNEKNHMIAIWPKWPSTLLLYYFHHRAMRRTIWSLNDQVAIYIACISLGSFRPVKVSYFL